MEFIFKTVSASVSEIRFANLDLTPNSRVISCTDFLSVET